MIGIIGCGAIGALLSKAVNDGIVKCDGLILYDYNVDRAQNLARSINSGAKIVDSVDAMLRLKPVLVVEAASQEAVREYAAKIIEAGVDLVVMSVGALVGLKLESSRLHVPSGAVGGLDSIRSAALAGIQEVTLITRKNPRALKLENEDEQLVFEGDAVEAVKRFPREMNVAGTLFRTVRPVKVNVRVISDPRVVKNMHEILVKWRFGVMRFEFANDPHPDNPGTSALAAWSAIRLVKDLTDQQ